jgi:hypothetical protein
MPFDPLFEEVPPSAALRAELGSPAGAQLFLIRFPTAQWPVSDPRLEGYRTVFVFSLDPDAGGRLPETWAPRCEPHRLPVGSVALRPRPGGVSAHLLHGCGRCMARGQFCS